MRKPTPASRSVLSAAAALVAGLCSPFLAGAAQAADDVFIYSSANQIRGLNVTRQTDVLLTTTPTAASANALAVNALAGQVYYGDDTSVYRWDPALGDGVVAHELMMNFATGSVQAPMRNLNSTAGSFLNGTYYVGSEADNGQIEELYGLQMSLDGTQVVSATPLGLLAACNCAPADLGGFGDIAALDEGGTTVLFGSSSSLGGDGGSLAGRWRFTPSTGTFRFLATAANGQMSTSLSGALYSNIGNQVREVDPVTGATGSNTLITTSAAIFDFTSGFAMDFGDAPPSYGAAFHRLGTGTPVRIGAVAPDNEAGTSSALSDDDGGVDDEDAIDNAAPVSSALGSHAVSVACSAGSRVAGWIDLDRDGRFEAGERNANHPASCVAGTVSLQWNDVGGATNGPSWLRLRASTNVSAISEPVGVASDGEVEDHPVRIEGLLTGSCPAGTVSTVYAANGLPRTIGPNAGAVTRSVIDVPADSGTVQDVNVLSVQGTHTYISDLRFSLSHGGSSTQLYGYSCGSQNDFSFSFNDEAVGAPPCPPTDGGTYPPTNPLSTYDGQPAAGPWQLSIQDRFDQDGGSLRGWSLEVCTAAPVATAPQIRLGKSASVDGREVSFVLALENVGDVALQQVQVEDDLDVAFGSGNWTLLSAPVVTAGPAGLAGNEGYTGMTPDVSLLAGDQALAPGESARVAFAVQIDVLSGVPIGNYRNSATAYAVEAAGSQAAVSDISNDGLDLSEDGDTPTPVLLDTDVRLNGRVFQDTSATAAQAHDGQVQPGEVGVSGVVIDAVDASGAILASTSTDGEGRWQLELAERSAGDVVFMQARAASRYAFVSEAPAHADGPVSDGRLRVVVQPGGAIEALDVGVVATPVLEADRVEAATAGSAVLLAHRYRAPTHGTLNVLLESGSDADRLLADADCDGQIDGVDSTLAAAWTVTPDSVHCLLIETFVPADAAAGTATPLRLVTSLIVSDPAGTGHGVVLERVNRDRITVLAGSSGVLELDKLVRNVSRDGVPGLSNAGLPGETLEYSIRYRNTGTGRIDELQIDDLAPAFTDVVEGSADCGDLPTGLDCTPSVNGASVAWQFLGSLPAGASGAVRYSVVID